MNSKYKTAKENPLYPTRYERLYFVVSTNKYFYRKKRQVAERRPPATLKTELISTVALVQYAHQAYELLPGCVRYATRERHQHATSSDIYAPLF